ncbi:unnamed protein product [Adineta steineri]|uniref:Glutamate--cysteine ligase n=1 Tax=Adineta steineri TaxID=433720 RepID=A0A819VPR6_9BILA|nr:unnamed protein product [Adineta steineri]
MSVVNIGVLTEGTALSWNEIVPICQVYRSYALSQLVKIFEKCRDYQGDSFLWGDELEFTLVHFDHSNKRVQLLLKAHEILPRLVETNEENHNDTPSIAWHPETCDFMIEGVPCEPYGFLPCYLNTVEANMTLRRKQAQEILSEQSDCEYIINMSAFPRYGQGQFIYSSAHDDLQEVTEQSIHYPDRLISPIHPRMKSSIVNSLARSQGPPLVHIPIFRDTSTPSPFQDLSFKGTKDFRDDHIHLDSILAGWGCCCLQVTFQAQSLTECLQVYDQLLPLTGIMLALSNACPIWRGYLTDIDSRYEVLFQTGDDRTPDERERSTLNSRCSPAPFYLCDEHNHLNDISLDVDENVVSTLTKHGMPSSLAHHFGHLFVRDPLVVIKESLHLEDDTSSYHFDNLNSTVWNSLRFKPPPLDDDKMGWRVEFRPMDIQITDFENASLSVFMALLTRVILTYGLDLTIPISQANENIVRAHHRDSVRHEKFYFRVGGDDGESSLMTINEIMNGNDKFAGLIPLVEKYLNESENINSDTRLTVGYYLSLMSKRAAGILLTDASWIRQFVMSHPAYKQDSVVSDEIQYDLMWKITQIANGHDTCPLLIQNRMKTNTHLNPE